MITPNQNEHEITIEKLQETFESARIVRGISGSHRAPSPEAMSDLAKHLEAIRSVGGMASDFACKKDAAIQFLAAMKMMRASLPHLRTPATEQGFSTLWAAVSDFEQSSVEEFLCAEQEARLSDFDKWKRLAPILVRTFRKAMRSTNPGIELRISNDGPVARFCAAVIPMITGEEPTAITVARHLQRQDR